MVVKAKDGKSQEMLSYILSSPMCENTVNKQFIWTRACHRKCDTMYGGYYKNIMSYLFYSYNSYISYFKGEKGGHAFH